MSDPREPYDPDAPAGDLLADIDVLADPAAPGRYTLTLSPAWNVFYTFGGVTMASALRAAERAVDRPDLVPLSANAVFCSPVAAGPVELEAEVLRSGKGAANVSVDLRQDGHVGPDLRLLATFGREHDTHVAFQGIDFPSDVLRPEECPTRPDPGEFSEARNPFPRINFHEQTDWRPAMAGFSWDDPDWSGADQEARFASWFRLRTDARLPDGTIDPVSLCVPADMLGSAIGRRMGPAGEGNPPFLILSLEINLQFLARTESSWILQHVVSQHAGAGYGYGTTELWDDHRRLVGFATQRARLRTFTPGEQLGPR